MNATPRNIISVARREFSVRAHTRSFVIGTAFLAIAGAALVLVPIGIRWFEGETSTTVGVVDLADPPTSFDPVTRLSVTLNASAATPEGESGFEVTSSPSEAAARAAVESGDLSAALVMVRDPGPDLAFTIISKEPAGRRTPELLRQASYSLAVADRLDRLGVATSEQAALFAPPEIDVQTPTPAGPGEPTTGAEMLPPRSSASS